MASITQEEENFLRQSMLVTGIAPRAVRVLFDREFPPPLHQFVTKNIIKLRDLNSKRVINSAQWRILNAANPVSTDFDMPLMIFLIRNFSSIHRSPTGFDSLPFPGDTSECADLVRIKIYRSKMAYMDDNKISQNNFMIAWKEVSEAVGRLGGSNFVTECKNLMTVKFSQPSQGIITEVKEPNAEVKNLRVEIDSLQKETVNIKTGKQDYEGFQIFQDVNNMAYVLSDGQYNSYENRAYLAGACNVGKSTLASVLIGEKIPSTYKSTDGLHIYFGRNGIDLQNKRMIPLKEGSAGHSVFGKVLLGNPSVQKRHVTTSTEHVEIKETAVLPKSAGKPIASKVLPLEHYKLHNEILQEIKDGKYQVKIAPSDLVDFGGQRSYDMTHQLFIQQNGSFMLMFDGRYKLTDQLEEYPQEYMTSRSILIHWVNSILTYCTEEDNLLPQILFVATHRDFLSEEEAETRRKEFEREITELFSNHDKCQHINYGRVYFINATDKDDKEIQALTDKLVDIAFKQPSWGQQRPIAWVPLELQIMQLRSDNVNIITKKGLTELNLMNRSLALNENELEEFLQNQHSIGKILYFNKSGLDKFVITQPSALINILRSFITDKTFWPENKELFDILKNMNSTGKLLKADLFKLWSQPQFYQIMPSEEVQTFIMDVLIHLDILVERKRDRCGKNRCPTEFLVPCIVTAMESDTSLSDDKFEKRTISLIYNLKRSTVPSALSFKLIGAAISIWPLKEDKEGRLCLFHQSAVLCIDESNELRIQVRDNKIVVYLSHRDTLTSISPDIAASIQECLTKALEYVLRFYYSSFGAYTKQIEVKDLFRIEIDLVCEKTPCVATIDYVKENKEWTCQNKKSHNSKYPLYWIFDRKQESCSEKCAGLTEEELKKCPTTKHLVRLASQITMAKCKDLFIQLGMKTTEWECIMEQHHGAEWTLINFKALYRWQERRIADLSEGTFGDLAQALTIMNDADHYLCQIFREKTNLLDIAEPEWQKSPSDDVLYKLSQQIGNCALHLCIELELDCNKYEAAIVRFPKDLYSQILDIMKMWKQKYPTATQLRLMQAIQRVSPRGLLILRNST